MEEEELDFFQLEYPHYDTGFYSRHFLGQGRLILVPDFIFRNHFSLPDHAHYVATEQHLGPVHCFVYAGMCAGGLRLFCVVSYCCGL